MSPLAVAHDRPHLTMLASIVSVPTSAQFCILFTSRIAKIPRNDIIKSNRKCQNVREGKNCTKSSQYRHQNLNINKKDVPKSNQAFIVIGIFVATAYMNIDRATPNVRLATPIPS